MSVRWAGSTHDYQDTSPPGQPFLGFLANLPPTCADRTSLPQIRTTMVQKEISVPTDPDQVSD